MPSEQDKITSAVVHRGHAIRRRGHRLRWSNATPAVGDMSKGQLLVLFGLAGIIVLAFAVSLTGNTRFQLTRENLWESKAMPVSEPNAPKNQVGRVSDPRQSEATQGTKLPSLNLVGDQYR